MNRRELLYSGTALTAMAAGSMTARSYASILGANDRVGLGVIGLGRRGTIVANAFAKDPRVQILALCDVYDQQVVHFQRNLQAHLSQPSVSVRYQELLSRKDVDAVQISTPDHLHVQVASDALGAGKNVYLEKPTLHHWREREALVRAASASKHVLQCGMQQRSGAHYMRAKEEVFVAGMLGDVVLVRAVWSDFPWQARVIPSEPKPAGLDWNLFLGPAPHVPYLTARYSSWRSYPDYGNGLLADILTHWVDVAQWMLDDDLPVRASALGGIYDLHNGCENPDTVSAIVQYKKWNLNFESSVLPIHDGLPSVYFEGTRGTLNLTREGYTLAPNQGEPITVRSKQNLEQAHTKNFIDAVLLGDKVNAPLSIGLAATLPVQMAVHSYWSGKVTTPSEFS
ncbi:MAG: Gfo/Idh/MocA family protein [Acidobacteriaceae bacterium]